MKRLLMTIVAASAAMCTSLTADASGITVDSVVQRWPFNNKVDITYTVSGGQDAANGLFCRIVFTASVDSVAYEIDGRKIGANASDGRHVATWTLPAGLKATGCTMTAALLGAENPSGDDYMVIDLVTGDVTFEGMLGTGTAGQAASNVRYSADAYKTSKMVLRKVPRWAARSSLPNAASLPSAGYPTGDDENYPDTNSATNWATAKDFYTGIFPVTQKQYENVVGTPAAVSGQEKYPIRNVFWGSQVRGSENLPGTDIVPDSSSAAFLPRLNGLTSSACGISGIDLPTEVMSEIAGRAGATTTFSWGDDDTALSTYAHKGASAPIAVGSLEPNAWGLYDTAGNIREWCQDYATLTNLANAPDAFTPATETGNFSWRGSGSYYNREPVDWFYASYRSSAATRSNYIGFRVAYIVK